MTLTLTDVITPTTAAEIEQIVLDLCATADPPLPVSSWQSGGVIRTMIAELSETISRYVLVDTEIAKGGFGDLASPEWAKLWAYQIYNVLFISARAATGYVTATNTTPTPHDLDPGDLIVAHFSNGKTYRNQEFVTIVSNATDLGSGLGVTPNIAVQADEVGTGSDAGPNDIRKIIAPGSLIGVTVSNPLAVLGADEELTEALVARTRAKLGSFSPLGPKSVYDYVARTPLDQFDPVDGILLTPTSTPITRSRTTGDFTTGQVVTYLGTAGGAAIPADVALVQLGFNRWAEPWGTKSSAAAASELSVFVSYRVWLKSSLTEAQVKGLINASLSRYFAAVPVGGVIVPPETGMIYREAITFVIHTAVPGIVRVEVTAPAAEALSLAPYQVPVLLPTSATVTFI